MGVSEERKDRLQGTREQGYQLILLSGKSREQWQRVQAQMQELIVFLEKRVKMQVLVSASIQRQADIQTIFRSDYK